MPTHSGRSSRLVGHPCPRLVKGRPRSPKHPASPPYLSHRRVVLDVECADASRNAVLLGIMRPPTRQPSPRVDRATLSVGATLVRTCVRVDQGEPSREIPALVGDRSPVGRSPGRGRAAAPGARRCARGAGPDGARETSALRPRRHAVGWTAACRAPARPRGRSLRAHPRRTPTGRTRDAPAVRATTPGVTELAPHPSEARTRGRWRPRSARRGRRNTSSIPKERRRPDGVGPRAVPPRGFEVQPPRLYQATFRSGKRNACRWTPLDSARLRRALSPSFLPPVTAQVARRAPAAGAWLTSRARAPAPIQEPRSMINAVCTCWWLGGRLTARAGVRTVGG